MVHCGGAEGHLVRGWVSVRACGPNPNQALGVGCGLGPRRSFGLGLDSGVGLGLGFGFGLGLGLVRRRVRLRIGYGMVRVAESHHGDTARVRRWQQAGAPQRESERAAERVAHQVERHAATVGDRGCNPRCAGCNPTWLQL